MDINSPAGGAVVYHASPPARESQTPPRIKPYQQISSTNGVLKRHYIHHAVAYKECLKNHAASMGGHALDGCGEFLPQVNATTADPTSLKCAACGCHRNFHRREPEDFPPVVSPVIEYHPQHRHHPLPPPPTHAQHIGRESHSPPPISSSYMLLALSGGGPQNLMNSSGSGDPKRNSSSRKRFRTKFKVDQKEKMLELAEKIGWKLQKTNDEVVNGSCSEIGVERRVFKVWMHNNKSTRSAIDVSGDPNGVLKSEENNNGDHHHHLNYNEKESNCPPNASSSSS